MCASMSDFFELQVSTIKSKLSDMLGIPPGKQKLQMAVRAFTDVEAQHTPVVLRSIVSCSEHWLPLHRSSVEIVM